MIRYGRPRPSDPAELAAWLFMRFSGLVLVFLALGHLAIMHLIYNVELINYEFVAARWSIPFW
ncbi:MAG: succinate dehydrogenase, partial [Anaerolineae bacterium]